MGGSWCADDDDEDAVRRVVVVVVVGGVEWIVRVDGGGAEVMG